MGKAISALRGQEVVLRRARLWRGWGEFKIDVYAVGSKARGECLEDSDIDPVIVCDEMGRGVISMSSTRCLSA